MNSSPELAIEVELIATILAEIPIGSTASYDAISRAINRPVQERRHALEKAVRMIEERDGTRFATVRGLGVRKLAGADVAGIGAFARQKIARTAKRTSRRLSGLRYNDVPPESRARIDAERSLLAAIASAAADESIAKVEANTTTGPIAATAALGLIATGGAR